MCWIKNNLLWLCLLGCTWANAQQPFGQCEFSLGAGGLIPIYDPFPKSSGVGTFTFRYHKPAKALSWRMAYGRTRLGWQAQAIGLGNAKVLGHGLSVAPIADMICFKHKDASLHARVAIGLGVFTKPHHLLDNPTNNVIGSRFTNVSRFELEYWRQISPLLRLGFGLHYVHASNAHFTVPNVGANIVGAHLSIMQNPLPPSKPSQQILLFIGYTKRYHLHVGAGYGLHEFQGTAQPVDGPRFADPTAHIQFGRIHRHRSSIYIGMQWTKYKSLQHYLLQHYALSASEQRSQVQHLNAHIGYDWYFSHAAFFVQSGWNVYHPAMALMQQIPSEPTRNWLYRRTASKLGYRIYLFNPYKSRLVSPYLQFAVKTNGGTAEFFEATIGIQTHW
jgi:hypothetical protein